MTSRNRRSAENNETVEDSRKKEPRRPPSFRDGAGEQEDAAAPTQRSRGRGRGGGGRGRQGGGGREEIDGWKGKGRREEKRGRRQG